MPQFDIATYFGQIFWFFVSFLFLYSFIKFVFTAKLNALLNVRAAVLQENKRITEEMIADLSRLKKVRDAALSDARFAAENMLRDAVMAIEQFERDACERLRVLTAGLAQENEALVGDFFVNKSEELRELFTKLAEDYYAVIYAPFIVDPDGVRVASLKKAALDNFASVFEKLQKCQ